MMALSRFRVAPGAQGSFEERAERAAAFFATRPGYLSAEVLQNFDDPGLWVIVSSWANVGSYRRAFNGYEAKVVLVPLLSEAIDEPSAYASPADVGDNLPRVRE